MIESMSRANRDLTKEEKDLLHALAEKAVYIQKGDKLGRWTREDRVAVVFSVLCSLVRLNLKNEKRKNTDA